jgi:phospholipase D1/2
LVARARGKRFNAAKASRNSDLPKGPSGHQNGVVRAMEILSDKAQHFIYIENQFFVSAFGASQGYDPKRKSGPAQEVYDDKKWSIKATRMMPGDADGLPQNNLCALLAGRIGRAILDATSPPFHVYITLPVHPEGTLDDGSVMTQVHWTMQTLVFGSKSLLNRIRRFIKARELYDKKDADWRRVFKDDNHDYKDVDIKRCFEHVTLLNLRNWDKLGERYMTEQIYVHSKLMVVDDRFALVGSANINDRSLLGTHDSELAVLLMDSEVGQADLCGDDKARPVRNVAHTLRQEVWKKLFGITGGIRPATELKAAIDKPADPKTWRKIQAVAARNTKLYEAAFDWIPRNKAPYRPTDGSDPGTASIWPRWYVDPVKDTGSKSGPMPFDEEFWAKPQPQPQRKEAAAKLDQVQGYITLLPIEWTEGENNNLGYHTALVVENDKVLVNPELPQSAQAETDRKQT